MEHWKLVLAGGAVAVAGMCVGAGLFGARPVRAQVAGYRECFVARQESVDTDGSGRVGSVDDAHTIRVPAGYVPIGGGGLGGANLVGAMVFCRP